MLLAGADKARRLATPFIRELRHAVGLRPLAVAANKKQASKEDKPALSSFKQYREKDGLFYFKLVSPQGQVLLQSTGFTAPREAGQLIARLQQEGSKALPEIRSQLLAVSTEQEKMVFEELKKIVESNK